MTPATATRDSSGAAACGAEGCAARNPWPLYPVRHRSVLSRLCTSCVLRQHPGSFCCSCFDLLDSPGTSPPGRSLARCTNCPAVAHLDCLREPDLAASRYLCPSCSNPHPFSYSKPGHAAHAIDLLSSKMIVAAACLSATSMARAAEAARADAERKARDAALGRKRAKEMIERLILVAEMEKESASAVVPLAAEQKKKVRKLGSSDVSANKKFQDRQREKLMRFQEPVEHRPLASVKKELNKPPAVNGSRSHGCLDAKAQGGSVARLSNKNNVKKEESLSNKNDVKREEWTKVGKGLPLNSQDVVMAKENEKGMAAEADKGSRKTQPTKDAPVLTTNSKDIAKGPPNAQSFRS